jgi:hypothetical protein
MTAIALNRPDLVEQLQQVATAEDTSTEELLDRAVIEFLEGVALRKLEDETATFERMHAQLVNRYLNEYVAIHNGAVVDHDTEVRHLYLRVRAKFGQMPILLRQVTEDVQLQELIVRSPKLVTTL